jgi:hypothetical protein
VVTASSLPTISATEPLRADVDGRGHIEQWRGGRATGIHFTLVNGVANHLRRRANRVQTDDVAATTERR